MIGSCYPAGARDTFGLAYRERDYSGSAQSHSALSVIVPFFASPFRVADWLRHGAWAVAATTAMAVRSSLQGRPPARAYVVSDMLEEIFLHHVARYGVTRAMDAGFPTVYAGFYAYDETAHGFGPEDPYCYRMLEQIDDTIGKIAGRRQGGKGTPSEYELIVLSDHGQVETVAFNRPDGRTLGEIVAGLLPTHEVAEFKGRVQQPKGDALDGHVALTYSGGLAHFYFKDLPGRLRADELDRRFPGLVEAIAGLDRVAFVLVRGEGAGLLVHGQGRMPLDGEDAAGILGGYDDAAALAPELIRLNSFERSGDIIIFGEQTEQGQVNFEHQVGGHGSIGGDQVRPFLLAKQEWGLDLSGVLGAADIYPILSDLRDRLAGS